MSAMVSNINNYQNISTFSLSVFIFSIFVSSIHSILLSTISNQPPYIFLYCLTYIFPSCAPDYHPHRTLALFSWWPSRQPTQSLEDRKLSILNQKTKTQLERENNPKIQNGSRAPRTTNKTDLQTKTKTQTSQPAKVSALTHCCTRFRVSRSQTKGVKEWLYKMGDITGENN